MESKQSTTVLEEKQSEAPCSSTAALIGDISMASRSPFIEERKDHRVSSNEEADTPAEILAGSPRQKDRHEPEETSQPPDSCSGRKASTKENGEIPAGEKRQNSEEGGKRKRRKTSSSEGSKSRAYLSEAKRRAVLRQFLEGVPAAEIADTEDISTSSVYRLMDTYRKEGSIDRAVTSLNSAAVGRKSKIPHPIRKDARQFLIKYPSFSVASTKAHFVTQGWINKEDGKRFMNVVPHPSHGISFHGWGTLPMPKHCSVYVSEDERRSSVCVSSVRFMFLQTSLIFNIRVLVSRKHCATVLDSVTVLYTVAWFIASLTTEYGQAS